MRWRITVRGEGVELRGWLDDTEWIPALQELSEVMKPFGVVIASPAHEAYDPFVDWEGGNPPGVSS
jgi:hypothetical protein